jgi:tetratricopeptide (TPR) repeat protein
VWAHIRIGRSLLESGDPQAALEHFSNARCYPHNLGEGKHLLSREIHLDYFAGLALSRLGREDEAREHWMRAAGKDDSITWLTYFRALSLEGLGREEEAARLLKDMHAFAEQQMNKQAKIDYFATSLPNLLLFEDDLQKRHQVECLFLVALAELGLRNTERAVELMDQVLLIDRNHMAAQFELEFLSRVSRPATVRPVT